jgi:5-formyltetrahydrofolate cyclo-ligase
MQQKQLIRQQIRQNIKNNLTANARKKFSLQTTKLIIAKLNLLNFNNINNIACYWPTKYEIDSTYLIKFLLNNNKSCYLPVINNFNNKLAFIKYTNNTKLIKNKFNILEPEFDLNNQINLIDLDLIFMPLVAFDSLGHRIGSGGGFYDRTLQPLLQKKYNIKLIGLAYSIQQIANFNPNQWDINLNSVVTEKIWLDCYN